MTALLAVVGGMGLVAGFFAYYSHLFYARSAEENGGLGWGKLLSLLCFFGSVLSVNMIMYSLVLIAQNESLTYLTDSVLVVGLQLVMWSTIIGIGLYSVALLFGGLYIAYESIVGWMRGRKKGDES